MGDLKSKCNDLLEIVHALYHDACAQCTAVVSDVRDLDYIKSRVDKEGISFLTITLPDFCRDFERSLSEGAVSASAFRRFRKTGAIPSFLKGMLGRLFNQETGRIIDLETDHPQVVKAIRQICLAFKKLELECAPFRKRKAVSNYLDVECDLKSYSLPPDVDSFRRTADLLWRDVLRRFNPDTLLPRHGSGAVVENLSQNERFKWQEWNERLEDFFPFWGFAYSVSAALSPLRRKGNSSDVTFVPSDEELPVQVILVPKTLKGPRVIAKEPAGMQYAQQSLRAFLYSSIEKDSIVGGHVNFSDQTVNQRLAIDASKSGSCATLDLSDASDRVPLSGAALLFGDSPLWDYILSCRSTKARTPDGEIVSLSKFASMGSALCFPIESMYFYTICVDTILRETNLPVNRKSVKQVCADVYVYGDDLIVPSRYAVAVSDSLQKYNCKVNTNKSFWSGYFRESCGWDAYAGELVTPVYLRRLPPSNRRNASAVLSTAETANAFQKVGFARTAGLLFSKLETILGYLPEVNENDGIVGRVSERPRLDRRKQKWRVNPATQRVEVLAYVPVPTYRRDPLSGYAALQKSLLYLENSKKLETEEPVWTPSRGLAPEPVIQVKDRKHLQRSVVRGVLALKRRWVAINF